MLRACRTGPRPLVKPLYKWKPFYSCCTYMHMHTSFLGTIQIYTFCTEAEFFTQASEDRCQGLWQRNQHYKKETSKGSRWSFAFWRKRPEQAHSSISSSYTWGVNLSMFMNNLQVYLMDSFSLNAEIFRAVFNLQWDSWSVFFCFGQINKPKGLPPGGTDINEAWQWRLCRVCVCDLLGDWWQVLGHLLLCYC